MPQPREFHFYWQGKLDNYLGVEIKKTEDRKCFSLTQPFLIERILQAAEIDTRMTNSWHTPVVGLLLLKDTDGLPCEPTWKYHTLTGMLRYLQQTWRPETSMSTHQCTCFNNDPQLCHEQAIKHICKYLLGTMDKGLIFVPNMSKGLECYVDTDFAGGWALGDQTSPESVLSRTIFVIMFARCLIYWCSKLQMEIALSTTEAEYIALLHSML